MDVKLDALLLELAAFLWCVFELAAFLKSKKVNEQVLLIKPTILGPCSMIVFWGISFAMLPAVTVPFLEHSVVWNQVPIVAALIFSLLGGYVMMSIFRSYFRGVEVLQEDWSSCVPLAHHMTYKTPKTSKKELAKETSFFTWTIALSCSCRTHCFQGEFQ